MEPRELERERVVPTWCNQGVEVVHGGVTMGGRAKHGVGGDQVVELCKVWLSIWPQCAMVVRG